MLGYYCNITALLYSSYNSKLTEEDKLDIDKSVFENHLAVKNLLKKVFDKSKVSVVTSTLGIWILFSIPENIEAVRIRAMPQAPTRKLDNPIRVPRYAKLSIEKPEKTTFLRNKDVRQIDKTYFN